MAIASSMKSTSCGARGRRLRRVLLGVWSLLVLGASPAARAGLDPDRALVFSVQDENGSFYTRGVVEFCYEGDCVFADIDLGFPGHFTLRAGDLQPDVPYTVMIYDTKMNVLYEMRDWVFVPDDYDPHWSSFHEVDKFLVFPQFHAHAERRLTFVIDTTLNPAWEELTGMAATSNVDLLPDYPTFWAGARGAFLFGNRFTSDADAAGGVVEGKPGFGLAVGWRMGYPATAATGEHWLAFREVSLAYTQNRYETNEVITPGRLSDVTFHRVTLSYGLGRQSPFGRQMWCVSAAVSLGGIYDGPEQLRYLDRDYGLAGAGLQLAYVMRVYHGRRVDAGLWLQAEAIYYPADAGDDDFWYGLAPAATVGLMIY